MNSRNRGRPKPTLRKLSRTSPNADQRGEIWRGAFDAHPIAAAILGAVMVEENLDSIIKQRLKGLNQEIWEKLAEDNGPLGTFNRKIEMARAMRAIDAALAHNLHVIRCVRNAFAHSRIPLNFGHELVVSEIRKTAIPRKRVRLYKDVLEALDNTEPGNAQLAYGLLCHALYMSLIDLHIRSSKASIRRYQAKRTAGLGGLKGLVNALQRRSGAE